MREIEGFMRQDHADCDAVFVAAEAAVGASDWERAGTEWARFERAMHHHFRLEEEIMFPAFEQETGMAGGPTEVMRLDHDQIRALFPLLRDALERRDARDFLGHAQSMQVLLQQHNMKEEQVLYPMADQSMADPGSLVAEMRGQAQAGGD